MGWFFLEENAYKLVVDTILDRQTVTEEEEPLPQLPAPPAPEVAHFLFISYKGAEDSSNFGY